MLEFEEDEDGILPIRLLLPLESVRVFVNGVKQTTDVRKGLKQDIGRQQAKEFYSKKGLLSPKVFDEVDWRRWTWH